MTNNNRLSTGNVQSSPLGGIRRGLFVLFFVIGALCQAQAQTADQLYKEGKALYDKEQYGQAVPKLRAAAKKNHKKAQYRLGRCYDKGRGVEENDSLAFLWYSKSAEQNYHKAQYQVGRCYKKGKFVKKDHATAFRYFLKSARQNNADAALALAECYMKGKGTEKNLAKAKQWVKRAVNNEDDGAEILANLKKDAKDGDEDAIELLKLLK